MAGSLALTSNLVGEDQSSDLKHGDVTAFAVTQGSILPVVSLDVDYRTLKALYIAQRPFS